MTNLENWALKQIDGLDIPEARKKQYGTVLNAFGKQGHSGSTAGYTLSYVNKYIEQGYEVVKESLDKMLENPDEDGMQKSITNDILEVINLFKEYGFGKDETQKLSRLMDWKPIIPLTGEDDEWSDISMYDREGSTSQQNKLCSAVFRDNFDNATAHYIYGRVYTDNGGHSWFTGNHKDGVVHSSTPVTFPFWVPDKPEYVYLNGDSEEIVTDKDRIKELYDEWDKQFVD